MNMKKLIKFEKDGCNPCNMVSAWLDERNVEYEKISKKRAYINSYGR